MRRPAVERGAPARQRLFAGVGALLSAVAVLAGAAATDRLQRTLPLAPGAVLEIDATIADLRLLGRARTDVAIEIVRSAPERADLDRFPVTIDADAARVRIAVRQAGSDARLETAMTIEVPADARIAAVRLGEGRLRIADFAGTLTADVRRGPIEADRVGGVLRLETGIGAIDLRQARLDPAGLIRARTFNGDLRLAFAVVPADARIMALALNGTVHSEIPLALKTAWGPRWGETTLGRGEPVVSLDVVTGDIRIEAP